MLALVTGASSGMGMDMARNLSAKGWDLILVARRLDRLEALKEELKTEVECIEFDLSVPENCIDLYEKVKDRQVDFLINNAGFGIHGKFIDIPLEKEIKLINTNIVAVHILTKLFLKDMVKRNSGNILNVASSAAFLAGPMLGSYYASKNYVLRFSEAIYEELRRDRSAVKISVLCPGPVKTEFDKVANVRFSVNGLESEYVAATAVDLALDGKLIILPGIMMKLARFGERFLPEKIMLKLSYNIQKSKNPDNQ